MQIDSLKVFCDLAETESFTKAAQINSVTQSAVSQQISALERAFKSLLIERSKKKFRLTREGQVLYEYSKQIIQTYDSMQNRLQEIKDIISGTISVATIYSIGLHDLPPYLKKFLKLFPTVNVHVEYRRANQVYEDVLGNVVDMGLVAYPTRDPKLDVIPLRKDTLVLICHPHHPLAKSKSIKLNQLAGQLTEHIRLINTSGSTSAKPSERTKTDQALLQVINGHLETLSWIDARLEDAQRSRLHVRKMSERAVAEQERLLFG